MSQTNTAEVVEFEPSYFKDPNNPTLPELVRLMESLDNGIVDFDPEQHAAAVGEMQVKIDNYKRFIDQCDLEEDRVAMEIMELQNYKKRITTVRQNLKNLLLYYHEKGQLLPGKNYEISIRKSSRALPKVQPNEDLYLTFPDAIRTKLEWDLNAVKNLLKSNPDSEVGEFVEVVESKSVGFKLRKGVDV